MLPLPITHMLQFYDHMLTCMPRTETNDTCERKRTKHVELNNFHFQDVQVSHLYTVALYSTSWASLVFNEYTCEICTQLHLTVHSEPVSFSPPDTCMTGTHGLISLSDAYSTPAVLQTKCNTLVAGVWHVPQVYSVRRVQYGCSRTIRSPCARFKFVWQNVHCCNLQVTGTRERVGLVRQRVRCKQSLQD